MIFSVSAFNSSFDPPPRRKSGLSSVSIRVYPWLIFSGSFTTD